MWRTIFHKFLFALLLAAVSLCVCIAFLPTTRSYALTNGKNKPSLTLNRPQGPLGVTLSLRGKNFPAGLANLSYIDATNVPGIFSPPSDTSVEVLPSGTFLTTNLVLPPTGPTGNWKIVVTDSQGSINTIRYNVLAIHGQKSAGIPTLTLTLPTGTSGSNTTATPSATTTATELATPTTSPTSTTTTTGSITFTGTNWLPKGTAVKLILLSGATSLPLIEPAAVSDANGDISGSFFMPTSLTVSTASINATDVATGALRAQVPISISNGVVSFSPASSPQPIPDETPVTSAASTPVSSTSNNGPNSFTNPLGKLDAAIWGPILLIAGGMLAIAGLMLILFMIPWSHKDNHRGQHTRSGQF